MPIKLEIFGDTHEAFAAELAALSEIIRPVAGVIPVTVSLPATIAGASLEELHKLVVERFNAEGYEVTISQHDQAAEDGLREIEQDEVQDVLREIEQDEIRDVLETEPLTESEPKSRKRGRPRRVDVETAARSLKGNGADSAAEKKAAFARLYGEEPDPAEDPEGDRQYVLDTLDRIRKDPKRKADVFAFAARMAKTHGGGDKISELPPPPFPAIRREMEKEFSDA